MQSIDKAQSYLELNLQECGKEICIPEKNIVLSKKSYHLFHYVVHGKGQFQIDGKLYTITEGMIFYIPPHSEAKYAPDKNNPWTYIWLGVDGALISKYLARIGLSRGTPILKDNEELNLYKFFNNIYSEYKNSSYLDVVCLGIAYELFGVLLKTSGGEDQSYSETKSYIIFAKEFIENNYQFPVKISDIANSVGVTPNYLTNIFQQVEHCSPKQYLINTRMEKAKIMLETRQYKIKDIAEKTGYKNQLHFSNEFKKFYGVSPKNFIGGTN